MSRWQHRIRLSLAAALGLGAALAAAPPAAARSITGVCPDGSIFIVSRPEAVPCRDAKQVEPHEVPPLNPEFLPRPYGWERFNQETDPNNPYNMVETLRAGPAPRERTALPPAPPQAAPAPGGPPQSALASAVPPMAAGPPRPSALALGLSPDELRDLAGIVGLMQAYAPASAVRRDAAGQPLISVLVAHSAAFDARLRAALAQRGEPARGPIVLFQAIASAPAGFYGNFTFVQGHAAFHPDAANPAQFGLVSGHLGELAAGDSLLGYALLPEHMDLTRPLDIYWNDLQISATLRP